MPAASADSPPVAVEALRDELAAGRRLRLPRCRARGRAGNGMQLNAADGPDAATGAGVPSGACRLR